MNKKNGMKTIVAAGLLSGALDALAAMVQYKVNGGEHIARIFQYIAGGIFGKPVFDGGAVMICVGVLLHYFIAFTFTVLFFFIYPKINILAKKKIITGLIYGIIIWIIMNFIVVPVSNTTPKFAFNIRAALVGALILMFAVGLPISLIVGNYHDNKKV